VSSYLSFTFAVPLSEWEQALTGGTMDTNALNELIAKARETAASLAQAEQRVAAFSAELAEQPALGAVAVRSIESIPKRNSGWMPSMKKLPKAS
jgi:hypothetical protein